MQLMSIRTPRLVLIFDMKKIIEHAKKEKAVFCSDFSGHQFDECGPDAEVTFSFNYGSKYDGSQITLHLTDNEVECLFDVIKSRVTSDYKKEMNILLHKYDKQYDEAMAFRDWDHCNIIGNNVNIIKHIINYEEK
jgi:hypothetical protein